MVHAAADGERELAIPTSAPASLDTAIAAAHDLRLRQLAKKEAPVRHGFILRQRPEMPNPPMIQLLRGERGGAGGDVRLRLMLSLLWCVRDDPRLIFPFRAWAELIGLDSPDTTGARRVRTALRWLDTHEYLDLESAPGRDAVVHLREDTGTGKRYELPGAVYPRLKDDAAAAAPHRYIRLPHQLWTNGWISVLNGPALVVLLMLWAESGQQVDDPEPPWVWVSPRISVERYGLSEDTRLKGARELTGHGLIGTTTASELPDQPFRYRRGRNIHQVRKHALNNLPHTLGQRTRTNRRRTTREH